MSYEISIDDVFEFDNNDYITLDKYKYNGTNYLFTNKLIDEDTPGKEFFVFKMLPNGIVIEKDKTILDEVYVEFNKNFNNKLETIAENSN